MVSGHSNQRLWDFGRRGQFWYKHKGLKILLIFAISVILTSEYLRYNNDNGNPGQISPRSRKLNTRRHDKWIVVTSIFQPTEQIWKLSQIPGWKLLVVADKKTPSNWTFHNAEFLDINSQEELGYSILKYVPWNAYTRKMIGYLYAIEHGAQFIYDTDDDNAPHEPENFEQNYDLSSKTRGLVTGNMSYAVNPYVHFGQPTVWPRGYPLDQISEYFNKTYTFCQMETPLIQQGLVNGDPDVDAIFRLTRKRVSRLDIKFDNHAPPIIYPAGVLAPFNSQNTLIHYQAFWGLVLPISVTFRVTDIWRGYWVQPLLWLIGGRLGFYSPHTTQIRNSHIYLKDFAEEDKLYVQSGDLARFLTKWNCTQSTLYACMLELTEAMVNQNMWSKIEIDLMQAWISDLEKVGYKEPVFRNQSICLGHVDKSEAVFNAVDMNSMLVKNTRSALHQFCNLPFPRVEPPLIQFPNTLLVITFNHPFYENIWLLDLIYRPHYPNIVYCGELPDFSALNNLTASKEFVDAGVKDFTFMRTINITHGSYLYECALRAIDMKFSVTGYLVVADDILLNFWNMVDLNPNEMWVQNQIHYRNLDKPLKLHEPVVSRWSGWNYIQHALEARAAIQNSSNPLINQFTEMRLRNGLNWSMIGFTDSDLFYLPTSKQDIYYEVGTLQWKAETALDFATTLLADGLSSPENLVHLKGASLWKEDRKMPFKFFNASETHLHPFKLSIINTNAAIKREYCFYYISKVLGLELPQPQPISSDIEYIMASLPDPTSAKKVQMLNSWWTDLFPLAFNQMMQDEHEHKNNDLFKNATSILDRPAHEAATMLTETAHRFVTAMESNQRFLEKQNAQSLVSPPQGDNAEAQEEQRIFPREE